MKIRVIPTILTDGLTVVKGQKFDNWRTVGTAEASARLFAKRDVDELLLLDVTARSRKTIINRKIMEHFSSVLDVPFIVGGGISSLEDAKLCFRYGAEKIVLGTSAIVNPELITQIADTFGSQAVIVSVDFKQDDSNLITLNSGSADSNIDGLTFIERLQQIGAGELLLQSVQRDGTLKGMDFCRIKQISALTKIPIIASGGAATLSDFQRAVSSGASAISAGALFQFTQLTPKQVRSYLIDQGISTRVTG